MRPHAPDCLEMVVVTHFLECNSDDVTFQKTRYIRQVHERDDHDLALFPEAHLPSCELVHSQKNGRSSLLIMIPFGDINPSTRH